MGKLLDIKRESFCLGDVTIDIAGHPPPPSSQATLLIWRRWNKFGHYKFIAKDVPYGSINSGTGPKL